MDESGLHEKLSTLLGGRTAAALGRAFNQTTIGDLLAHYPRRYALHGEVTELGNLPLGEQVTLIADVVRVSERRMNKRKGSIFEVLISDGRGTLTLTFFNQSWRKSTLVPGARGAFAGKITEYRGTMQLTHPDYKLFERDEEAARDVKEWAETPIPIYPATASIPSWTIQNSIGLALDHLGLGVPDPLPAAVRDAEGLLDLGTALERIHRPRNEADWRRARRTLRFHEAFLLQAALLEKDRKSVV